MKPWARGLVEEKPAPVVHKDPMFEWQCIKCERRATILLEGTSYCFECAKEEMRTGKY